MKKFSLIFFLLPISLLPLLSQEDLPEQEALAESSTEQEEASPFLWEYQINDNTVELFWEGYWKLGFSTGLGFTHTPEGDYFPSQYPGLTNIIGFDQEPDLLLSLWLNKRWFMETSFVKDYNQNTFALGFQEDQWFINHLRLGNSDLDVQGFAGLSTPAPKYNTPGILMEAAGSRSQHEMLFRLDGSVEEQKIYQGRYLVSEETHSLGDWQEGRFFILPNINYDSSSLLVYQESSSGSYSGGDGHRYRLMEGGEYTADPQKGLLDLAQPASGRLLVYYTKGGSDIGSPGLATAVLPDVFGNTGVVDPLNSTNFEWANTDIFTGDGSSFYSATRQVTVNGKTALLIKAPEQFSPFEFYSFYESGINFSDDEWKNGAELVYKNSYRRVEGESLTVESQEEGVRIYRPGISIRDPRNRYPLQDIYPQLYGPGGYGTDESGKVMLRLFSLQKSDSFSLPDDLVTGSLQVYYNGYTTADYQIDGDNLRFNRFIYPSDRIEIHYRRENPQYEGGELLFYQGNAFSLGARNELELGSQVRWILPGGTQEFQEGVINLSGIHRFQGEQLQSTLSLSGTLTDPDTDGFNRLLSMENDKSEISIYPDVLQNPFDSYSDTAITGGALNTLNFVTSFEEDYDDPEQGLLTYSQTPLGLTGEKGPSAAAPLVTDLFGTPVMILPVDISTSGQWTGGSLMLHPKGQTTMDLSTLQELRFLMKWLQTDVDPGENINVELIIGQSGESEDHNGNGILDNPDPDYYVLKKNLTAPTASWNDYTISFTDQERSRLQSAQSLTLLVFDDNRTENLTGSLILGNIRLYGQSFATAVRDSSDTLIQGDIIAREVLDSSLEASFPAEIQNLHSSGEYQRVTQITWGNSIITEDFIGSNLGGTDYWTATRQLPSPVSRDFRFLTFFIRDLDTGSGSAQYTLSYLDNQGKGLELSFIPGGDSAWKKVRFNLQEGKLDSSDATVSQISWDPDAGDLTQLIIRGENDASGTFEIDELYQEESIYTLSSQGKWDLVYRSPAEWSTEGGFPLFSGLKLSSSITGQTFERLGYSDKRDLSMRQVLDLESNLTLLYLGGWIDYSISSGTNRFEGGHRLRFPWFDFPLQFSEGFRSTDGQESLLYSQERSLAFRHVEVPVTIELSQESQSFKEDKKQHWLGNLAYEDEGLYSANLTGNVNLTREETSSDPRGDYFYNWGKSWADLAVKDENHLERVSDLNLQQHGTWENLALDIGWNFHQVSSFTPQWTSSGSYNSTLTLPIQFGPEKEQQTLEFSYNRGKTWERERVFENHFYRDWQDYLQNWSATLPLVKEIPLLELFTSDYTPSVGVNQQSNTYKLMGSASYSRLTGSSLGDLFFPSLVTLDFGRIYQQNHEENWYKSDWDFTLEQNALNLFGRFGTYPLLFFYLSDEIRNSWSYRLSSYNSPLPDPASLGWNFYLSLKGERELRTSLENQLDLDFSGGGTKNQVQWDISWRTFSRPYYRVPTMDWIIDREFFVEQQESISYSINQDWNGQNPLEQEFFLEHHWLLHFTGWGTFDSWLKWAYRNEEKIWQTGAEIGFEMVITF